MDICKHNQKVQEDFFNSFIVNKKVLDLDLKNNINEIVIHHYLIREMKYKCSLEVKATLREMEYKTNLSLQQIRTAINKLEEKGIIEIIKGAGKTPSIYKYVIE